MAFLSFNDIQSDYYQIPKSDLEKIKQEEEKAREKLSKEVEAKDEKKKIAEGKLEIDDPIEKEDTQEKNNLEDEKEKKNEKNLNLKDIKFKKLLNPIK